MPTDLIQFINYIYFMKFGCLYCLVHFLFQLCFEELERQYDETAGREKKLSRDDWAHGSLLITLELLRFSNVKAEVNKLNSIAWLFCDGSIRKYQFTLHYITFTLCYNLNSSIDIEQRY